MKIMHSILEQPIEIEENMVPILQIESQKVYRNLIKEIYGQIHYSIEGSFILSDGLKQYSCKNDVELIIDVFSLNVNDKKILSKLYKQLEERAMGSEYYIETQEIMTKINQYILTLIEESDIPLECEEKLNIQDLFKIEKMNIQVQEVGFLERLIDYMKVTQEFLMTKIYIFVGLKNYISNEELEQLYKFWSYNKIRVLLLENNESQIHIDCEKYYILDCDGCEIY